MVRMTYKYYDDESVVIEADDIVDMEKLIELYIKLKKEGLL